MKAYLIFLAALIVSSFFIEYHLIDVYRPSISVLEQTRIVTGKVHLIWHKSGSIPDVDGIPFMCRMNFFTSTDDCMDRLPKLHNRELVTVAFADVPATVGTIAVAMSITTSGKKIYTITPKQVIDEYVSASRSGLFGFFIFEMFLFFIFPFMFSVQFREAFAALFD